MYKVGSYVWRAEPMPHLYGSWVCLNVYGTNKMERVFVLDFDVKGHPERLQPFVDKLKSTIADLQAMSY